MAVATDNGRMITLISSDGERFEVPTAAAVLSPTVLGMMIEKNDSADNGILLPNVTGRVLAKVIQYCIKHAAAVNSSVTADAMKTIMEEELKNFDDEFIQGINNLVMFDLIRAAKDMGVDGLVDLGCQRVADLLKGKTPEQMRQMFEIANDFAP